MAPRPPYPEDGCITAENLAIIRGLLNNKADPKAVVIHALETYSTEVVDLIIEFGVTEDALSQLTNAYESESNNDQFKADSRAYYSKIAQFTRAYLNARQSLIRLPKLPKIAASDITAANHQTKSL
jgi:hypothetical protein